MSCVKKQDYSNDILQEITEEQLVKYLKICEQNLPKAIRAHHALVMHQRWKRIFAEKPESKAAIGSKCNTYVFVHRNGIPENGTFFSVSEEALLRQSDVSSCQTERSENYSCLYRIFFPIRTFIF